MRKYLPVWTDRCNGYDEQYVAANIILDDVDNKESLLPVRFKDDLTRFYKRMHADAEYTFAKALYKKAAEKLFGEYGDIDKIEYGEQEPDGVYKIKWRYPPEHLKKKLFDIMREMIEEGFSVSGCAACSFDECMKYYVVIDEKILMLGNQQRIYHMTYGENKPLFDAAADCDFGKMCQLAENGCNLNAMNSCGCTPLSIYIEKALLYDDDSYGILPQNMKNNIEKLIEYGAKLSVFGVTDEYDSLLHKTCVHSNVGLVRFMLERGVNPNLYSFMDDYCCEKEVWLIDWEEAHTTPEREENEEDIKAEELRVRYTKEICNLLKEYMF